LLTVGPNLLTMLRLLMQTEELIPEDVRERADEIIDTVKADPTLLAILVVVGILTLGIFLWGITKQVFKAALFAGLASAGIWYWYFNIR
jgi:hypothetical protein